MTALSDSAAIILGASKWPNHDRLEGHQSFANSANDFKTYVSGHGVRALLDLFDTPLAPYQVTEKIQDFLTQEKPQTCGTILFYYVGHGGSRDGKYLLSLACTSKRALELSSLPVQKVAHSLYDQAPGKRHIVILDSCYAGAAAGEFVEMSIEDAASAMHEGLREVFPSAGTSLLCAASSRQPALARREDEFTMFSGALRAILRQGDPTAGERLSLGRTLELAQEWIKREFPDNGVRPEIHSPRQPDGDLRHFPYFPNPAWTAVSRETGPDYAAAFAREIEWEAAATALGCYELRESRKEIDQFGDSVQVHRGADIRGPAKGALTDIPYYFRTAADFGTCVIEQVCDAEGRPNPRASIPSPSAEVDGVVPLIPPATAQVRHAGFSVRVRLMNSFAVIGEDARERNLQGSENTYAQCLLPTRLLRMVVLFPPDYAPLQPDLVVYERAKSPEGAAEWLFSTAETARLQTALFYDQGRGVAVVTVAHALPQFRYFLEWRVPPPPNSLRSTITAREQIRRLFGATQERRLQTGIELGHRRDAICQRFFDWSPSQPRTVLLSLFAFNEATRRTEIVCCVPELQTSLSLPSGAGVVGRVMKRRRPLFVDTSDPSSTGVYWVVPDKPVDRFVFCVPVPLPALANPDAIFDRRVPCVIAALTCFDETGNLERLASVEDDLLTRSVADALVAATLEVIRPLIYPNGEGAAK